MTRMILCLYILTPSSDVVHEILDLVVEPGSNRHRIGIGWANKGQQSSKFWSKRPDFCCLHAAKSAGSTGIRPFRPEFRTLLTFVGPSYTYPVAV